MWPNPQETTNLVTFTEKICKSCDRYFYQILIFRQMIALQKLWKMFFISSKKGQVDSPESPETPEITEIIENFIKVTKHLTKLKETLTNFVWEKSHFKKQ